MGIFKSAAKPIEQPQNITQNYKAPSAAEKIIAIFVTAIAALFGGFWALVWAVGKLGITRDPEKLVSGFIVSGVIIALFIGFLAIVSAIVGPILDKRRESQQAFELEKMRLDTDRLRLEIQSRQSVAKDLNFLTADQEKEYNILHYVLADVYDKKPGHLFNPLPWARARLANLRLDINGMQSPGAEKVGEGRANAARARLYECGLVTGEGNNQIWNWQRYPTRTDAEHGLQIPVKLVRYVEE